MDVVARIEARLVVADSGCLEWQGGHIGPYGVVWYQGRNRYVHRLVHELFVGPVEPSQHVDHRCSNEGCAHPGHLEAVSKLENRRRTIERDRHWHNRETCRSGRHAWTEENIQYQGGKPYCGACRRLRRER